MSYSWHMIPETDMIKNRLAVASTNETQDEAAKQIALKLNLFFIGRPNFPLTIDYDYLLLVTPHYLGLQKISARTFRPFYIDFTSGTMLYRLRKATLHNELIARAMGKKPKDNPLIIDATAGLGRDSFILAALGFQVTMLERSPILYLLLKDGLDRAGKIQEFSGIVQHLTLICDDAKKWLQHTSQKPQIIYLDPMFPERKKSASVKKDMQILQDLLGKDHDSEALFSIAKSCASERIVVKRPQFAPNIKEIAPNYSLSGKNNRFDIYLT